MFPATLIWLWTVFPALNFSTLQNKYILSSGKLELLQTLHSLQLKRDWSNWEFGIFLRLYCFSSRMSIWVVSVSSLSIGPIGHIDHPVPLSSDNLLIIDGKLCSHSPFSHLASPTSSPTTSALFVLENFSAHDPHVFCHTCIIKLRIESILKSVLLPHYE